MIRSDTQWPIVSQSKFQMFTLFPAAMSVSVGGTPTWRLHTGLFKYVHNILKNIWRSGKCTDLKLGEVSQSSISYNFIISWVNWPNNFRIIFLIAWRCNPRISTCIWNLPFSSLIWGSILPISWKLLFIWLRYTTYFLFSW